MNWIIVGWVCITGIESYSSTIELRMTLVILHAPLQDVELTVNSVMGWMGHVTLLCKASVS